MAAPKGHPLWGNPIKPKKYTPEQLWEKSLEYFAWCDDNPIMVTEQVKMPQRLSSEMIKELKPAQIKAFMRQTIELPRQRAYTIEGLCLFLNISRETFDNYSKCEANEVTSKDVAQTYVDVSRAIRDIINKQHLECGYAETLNPNIAIRKLGLTDKKDLTSDGKQIAPTVVVQDKQTSDEVLRLTKTAL